MRAILFSCANALENFPLRPPTLPLAPGELVRVGWAMLLDARAVAAATIPTPTPAPIPLLPRRAFALTASAATAFAAGGSLAHRRWRACHKCGIHLGVEVAAQACTAFGWCSPHCPQAPLAWEWWEKRPPEAKCELPFHSVNRSLSPGRERLVWSFRTPNEMMVSGYLYHKGGAEYWPHRPMDKPPIAHCKGDPKLCPHPIDKTMSNQGCGNLSKFIALSRRSDPAGGVPLIPVAPNETWVEYLGRQSLRSGLLAHMVLFNFTVGTSTKHWKACTRDQTACKAVCLDWFSKAESDRKRDALWADIARFWEYAPTQQEQFVNAVRKGYAKQAQVNAATSHATAHGTPERDELLRHFDELDATYFQGRHRASDVHQYCRQAPDCNPARPLFHGGPAVCHVRRRPRTLRTDPPSG